MTKNQSIQHGKRKHKLQLRRDRKNKKVRLHDQLMAKHAKRKAEQEANTATTLTEPEKS